MCLPFSIGLSLYHDCIARDNCLLVILGDPLSLRSNPLEVPHEFGVGYLRLAREEEVPTHGHVVRARRDHHQLVHGGRLTLGTQQLRGGGR
jgi:hypothetical protein